MRGFELIMRAEERYLMKNKTFINAHLIKNGYTELDTEFPFKYRPKFQELIKRLSAYENEIQNLE